MSNPFSFTTDSTCPLSVCSSLSLQQVRKIFDYVLSQLKLTLQCRKKESLVLVNYLATSARFFACSAISDNSL